MNLIIKMVKLIEYKVKEEAVAMFARGARPKEIVEKYGMDRKSLRRILKERGMGLPIRHPIVPSNEVVADEMLRKIEACPEVMKKSFDDLAAMVGSTDVVGVLRNPEKYDEVMRETAKAKFWMCIAAINREKIEAASPNAIAAIIPILAEMGQGKIKFTGFEGKGEIRPEELIEKITLSVTKIRQFNPALAKETQAVLDGFIGMDKGKMVKAIKKGRTRRKYGSVNSGEDAQSASTVKESA